MAVKNGIEMFREYFQFQQSVPLSAVEQAIITHLIWLMNENRSNEIQITVKQLSARCNVDVRSIRAKLPQLCNKNATKMLQKCCKNVFDYAKIEGDICMVGYKNVSKSGTVPNFQPPNELINKCNIINGNFKKKVKEGEVNAGECQSSIFAGGNAEQLSWDSVDWDNV